MSEGNLLSLEKFGWYFFFSSCLCIMHVKICKFSAALFTAETRKRFKRLLLAESEYHSARLLFLFHADIFYVYSSFTKLKSDHSVFASNFEIIQSILDLKPLMLHVCSIFVWIMIKMQWLLLILNGKSTDKALFCLYA